MRHDKLYSADWHDATAAVEALIGQATEGGAGKTTPSLVQQHFCYCGRGPRQLDTSKPAS